MLFNWTKHENFQGRPLFQAMYNIKTEKQTKWCPFPSNSLPASNWPRLSELIVCFCFSCCMELEEEDFIKNLHVLSCFVRLKSILFNLLCDLQNTVTHSPGLSCVICRTQWHTHLASLVWSAEHRCALTWPLLCDLQNTVTHSPGLSCGICRRQVHTHLASLLCTTGGNCCGSPTSTNLSALNKGPRHAGCSTCDASSTMHKSNLRCVNTGWLMPRQLVATMP